MRVLLASCLLALSLTSHGTARASDGNQVIPTATNASVQPEMDAETYLAKIDSTLALAYSGQYGNLKRGAGKRLEDARSRIAAILEGQETVADLPLADRVEIRNAEDVITSILRNKERDRMVCRRDTKTGTRFSSAECLTVAQREARAAAAGEGVDKVQRNLCYPGEGNACQ